MTQLKFVLKQRDKNIAHSQIYMVSCYLYYTHTTYSSSSVEHLHFQVLYNV
jgi:hypothetical protein